MFLLYHIGLGSFYSMTMQLLFRWVSIVVYMAQHLLMKTYSGSWGYPGMMATLWHLGGGISTSAYTFLGSWLTSFVIWLPQRRECWCIWNGTCLCWVRLVSILFNAFSNVALWCLPRSSNATIKVSSAMLNTLGSPLHYLSIFLLNISPACATPNGSHIFSYLSNIQEKAVR